MREVWTPAYGHDGYYSVSSLGRVRSELRVIVTKAGVARKLPGKLLKPQPNSRGYSRVCIRDAAGKTQRVLLHRLILSSFTLRLPNNLVACHKDDNKQNNNIENLYWGTPSNNARDKVLNGKHEQRNKTRCINGHSFSGVNLYVSPKGHRSCRQCKRAAAKRRRKRGEVIA